ncbi:MAG TPA: VOC family protein [Candidatus Kapabacteria bacterium]|nr:VOC family protein [Candidatus Kapabacteria bacterium]
MLTHLILYVADQAASTAFYAHVLEREPSLNVPGMTEFTLGDGCVLGLMPAAGIRRLLGEALPDPDAGHGIPRCELYLHVDDPAAWHRRALAAGARELSPPALRNWGDVAAYSIDADGHVLAVACTAERWREADQR